MDYIQILNRSIKKIFKGIHVPPFGIISVTDKCNLQCRGCYARLQNRPSRDEIDKKIYEN